VKLLHLRDVPPGAAAVVVALALVASLVTGAPWTAAPQTGAEPTVPSTEVRPEVQVEPLDLQRMERKKASGTVPDLFANPVSASQPGVQSKLIANAAPTSPPTPAIPVLPFKYLGRLDDGERVVVFLESGQNLYSAGVGETLDNAYRIESISDTTVIFRHLTLGVAQTLAVPKAP
jgi:Tfp pilus assembly protein PilP